MKNDVKMYIDELKHFISSLGEPITLVTEDDFWEFDYPINDTDKISFTVKWKGESHFIKDFIFARHLDIQMIDFERKAFLISMPMETLYYSYQGPFFEETDN